MVASTMSRNPCPAPSGISDYSEELLPYLGRYAEITLYLDDRLRPGNPLLAQHLEVRPISRRCD